MTKKNKIGVIGTISLCVFSILILTAQVTRTTAALEVANSWSAIQTFAAGFAAGSGATVTSTGNGGTMASQASQTSAATTFGSSLSSQTVISSVSANTPVDLVISPYFAIIGSGCTGISFTVTITVVWNDPNGNTNNDSLITYSFVGNGGRFTVGNAAVEIAALVGNGDSLTYTATSTAGSSCSTTQPQYAISATAIY